MCRLKRRLLMGYPAIERRIVRACIIRSKPILGVLCLHNGGEAAEVIGAS